jgi:hypothetical protein
MKYNTIVSIITVCSVLLQIYVEKYGAALERQKRGHLLKTSSIYRTIRNQMDVSQLEATQIREATAILVHQTHVLADKPANECQEHTHAPPSRTSVCLALSPLGQNPKHIGCIELPRALLTVCRYLAPHNLIKDVASCS